MWCESVETPRTLKLCAMGEAACAQGREVVVGDVWSCVGGASVGGGRCEHVQPSASHDLMSV